MLNVEYLGGVTSVIVRPMQLSTLPTPRYYLFILENKNKKTSVYLTPSDISLNPGSYQEFEIQNGLTASSSMFVGDIGEYSVTIMDSRYPNTTLASASNIVWLDTMRVYGSSSPTFSYYTPTASNTFTYYK